LIQLVSLADGPLTIDANPTPRPAGGGSCGGGTGSKGAQENNAGRTGNGGFSADQMSILLEHVSASTSALPSPRVKKAATSTPPILGGATNMEITLATYREWSDNPHLGDVQGKDMTLRTARAIYRSLYWNPLRADALASGGVDLSVFDMGVNASIWRSARLLQQALGFSGEEVAGSIGPVSLAAADRFDARILVNNLANRQTAYYRSLANFSIFGTGWLRRTNARREAALAMIQSEAAVVA
jgi:hypothetical protein